MQIQSLLVFHRMRDILFFVHAVLQDRYRLFLFNAEKNLISVALFLYDQQSPYLPQMR